jgi:mannose-6-phosphate isomerase-like protein (cupin superfamily)
MKCFRRQDIPSVMLPGRVIQTAVGKEGLSKSDKITMGFARYSAESGPMEPHHHAEEVVYVVGAKGGWVRYGREKDKLGEHVPLEPGMVLHNPPLEWHVFGYAEGGYVDLVFIYGQVDQIRPEEMTSSKT